MSKSVLPLETNGPQDESGSGVSGQRRRELADFLRTRREKLKPDQVGIQQGARRRTPGLRREEVAELAGVGTTWYTWLEQARDIQPSAEVLRRLGQALQLNHAELRHMFVLAGKAPPTDLDSTVEGVPPSLKRLMHQSINAPAILLGARWDILDMNSFVTKYIPSIQELPEGKRNWLYYCLVALAPSLRTASWESSMRRLLAEFRASLSDSLDSPWVAEVVEMLKAESPEFARWWPEHDVRDNAATTVDIIEQIEGRRVTFERVMLKPMENPRYKILVFTPNDNS